MRMWANLLAISLMLASAWFLYAEGSATRRLEAQVQAAERQRERLEGDIAVLRAERAFLARPQRIEPAAKALGLRLPEGGDYVRLDYLVPDAAKER
jgi:cell division protein FtsL